MKSALSITAALLLAAFSRAETPPGWNTNFVQSLQAAQKQARPLLLDFGAGWCFPCRLMANTTLRDDAVIRDLDRFACVAIDIDASRPIAEAHGVSAVPTFLLMHSNGDELARATGYMDVEKFRAWLAAGMETFAAAEQRRVKFEEQKKQIGVAIRESDPAQRRAAARELFDLCARREGSVSSFALEGIKQLAARDPTLLLDGLNHQSLATRIHVSNALRDRLGAGFTFDPWEKPAVRRQMAAELRERMAKGNPLLEDPK